MNQKNKILSKIICPLLVIVVAFSTIAISCPNKKIVYAISGNGWSYENGILTITDTSGIGNYTKSSYKSRGWQSYANDIWAVNIEKGITKIGTYSFCELPNLKKISFPSTLTQISNGAFYHCSELSSVTIPEGVTEIGTQAFYNCLLATVCVPSTVTSIGSNAFGTDSGLTVFGCSDNVKKYCESNKIKYVPVEVNKPLHNISEYASFSNWSKKYWGDSNGSVTLENDTLKMETNNSYITAYCDEIITNYYNPNSVRITMNVESTNRELLNHIYGGYVISVNSNDLNYIKGTVTNCTESSGVYTATIEINTSLKFIGDYHYQIRLGRNNDHVTGTVNITSFKMEGVNISDYSSFSTWYKKSWGDSTGSVSFDNNQLTMETNDSYITAYYSETMTNDIVSNPVKISIEVESNNRDILNHIYGGYVIESNNNDLNYIKGNVVKCTQASGIYTATVEINTTLQFTGDYHYQIRLGRNNDHVTGTVNITSFKMESANGSGYALFSNWYKKNWGDSNGSISYEDNKLKMQTSDSYITAYCSEIIHNNDEIFMPIKIIINAESTDRELLNHLYGGYVLAKNNNDLCYTLGDVTSVSQANGVYKAEIVIYTYMQSEGDYHYQIRLGRNNDHVNGTVNITDFKFETINDYARVSIGEALDTQGITAVLPTQNTNPIFDISNSCDKADVILNLAMMYRVREGLTQVTRFEDVQQRYYIYFDRDDRGYMSSSSLLDNGNIKYGHYNKGAFSGYFISVKNQCIGFGDYHELSHSYKNSNFNDNFSHNSDDSEVNFRTFVAKQTSEYLKKLPIYDGRVIYADMVYDINKKKLITCDYDNAFDTYYAYKGDLSGGYIHDLTFIAYKKIYDNLEANRNGSGLQAFTGLFSGGTDLSYSSNDEQNKIAIANALKYQLVPGIKEYYDYDSLMLYAQRYLNCINYLAKNAGYYDLGTFCASDSEMTKLIRKAFYCTEVDHEYNGQGEDCIEKFIGDVNMDQVIDDNDYNGIVNYKNSGTKQVSILCGDINFDGLINNADADLLDKYLKGTIDKLYVP